jgi:hypothetical protein
MNRNGTLYPLVEQIRSRALVIGLAGAGLSLLGFLFDQKHFERAYLFTYIFLLGLSLGSLALLMIHRQVSGAWGFLIRRPLEAGAMTLPLMAVLFLPVLFDMGNIYPWVKNPPGATPEHRGVAKPEDSHKAAEKVTDKESPVKVTSKATFAADPASQVVTDSTDFYKFKKMWLNPTAFLIRFVIYFALWIAFALVLSIGSRRQDETGSVDLAYKLNALSAPGLVIYFLSVSFALIDWGMSLEPAWYSSLYGVLLIIGQGISAMAFMIIVAAVISRRGEVEGLDKPETFNDLGNLLLAFTMLWGYLSFSQFLIIWAGNLAEEIPWYMRRLHGGWEWFGRFLILFHFAVPFLILLVRPIKRNISALWKVAALVLFVHLIDDYWLIGASSAFDIPGDKNLGYFWPSWLDVVVPVALGGIWLSVFLGFLKSKPLMVAHDPGLLPALKQASGGH